MNEKKKKENVAIVKFRVGRVSNNANPWVSEVREKQMEQLPPTVTPRLCGSNRHPSIIQHPSAFAISILLVLVTVPNLSHVECASQPPLVGAAA